MFILLKAIYRFDATPIKIPMTFFHRNRKKNPKMCMRPQKTLSSQSNYEKEEKIGGFILSHFKLYYKATAIKTV